MAYVPNNTLNLNATDEGAYGGSSAVPSLVAGNDGGPSIQWTDAVIALAKMVQSEANRPKPMAPAPRIGSVGGGNNRQARPITPPQMVGRPPSSLANYLIPSR